MKRVYTKDNCPACVTLKASLVKSGEAFQEVKIVAAKDTERESSLRSGVETITREEFMSKFPTVRTVPYVEDDNK
jgi:glutaredoxin